MAEGKSSTINLQTFEENNPAAIINSPRSLQACKLEGVLPQDLIFRPKEAFQEKNLSPRLAKLRYDFYEAKRRDLLAASRRARDTLVAEDKRRQENGSLQLDIISKNEGVSKGAVLARQGDTLKLERQRLQRAHDKEKQWLQNALNAELKQLQALEKGDVMMKQEGDKDAENLKLQSQRMKELNDRRAAEEERKRMENDARQKLEKQIAKEEFHRQQEEIKQKAAQDALKAKEAYERQQRNAELKREMELEKERKREEEFQAVEARKNELKALDLRRMDILEQQKEQMQAAMADRQAKRDERIYNSIALNMDLEQKRRDDFEAKEVAEQEREERLMQARAMQQEEGAKKSFQLMMRRKIIQEEAMKKAEETRAAVLEAQEETEYRLLEHEQKKERYLDFKRELDGLRNKNKEINVERQRRREEAGREMVADQVRRKDDKIEAMNAERKRLWELRRQQQSDMHRARESVKQEIMRQRIQSKFNSKALEKKLESLMQQDFIGDKSLKGSTSMPALRGSPGVKA